ncbi:hypothetical protein ACOMHN_009666 [Nucella lapillus]
MKCTCQTLQCFVREALFPTHLVCSEVYSCVLSCSDPLLLDDLVLDNILEFVDGDTLLTGRLVNTQVCHRWKTEISQRSGLWRRRCERLGVLEPDKTFPPETDFFPMYLKSSRLLRQIARGQAWQVDDHCDGSHCLLHKEVASALQRQRHENLILHIAPDNKFQHHFGTEIAICDYGRDDVKRPSVGAARPFIPFSESLRSETAGGLFPMAESKAAGGGSETIEREAIEAANSKL